MHVWGEADLPLCLVPQGFLEEAEEASQARDGKNHAMKFANNLLPLHGGNAGFTAWQLVKDCHEAEEASRESLGNRVNHPAQHGSGGLPGAIASEEFLDGDGLLVGAGVAGAKRAEDSIDSFEKDSGGIAPLPSVQGNHEVNIQPHLDPKLERS
jgi:hypothetical protein